MIINNNKFFIFIKNFIEKYFLIFLGFIVFSLYFWNRFLRSRTSKDLPFQLNVFKFFILLYICIIFLYIIISLIFPRKQNKIIERLINILFTPLVEFDNHLKSLSYIKPHYEKCLRLLIPRLEFFIIKTNLFFIIFWIFPRLILLSALYIDVFIFEKFHYKYLVISFGLLLFFNRYFKYSLKKYKEDLIKYYSTQLKRILVPYKFGIHPSELAEDYDPEEDDNDDVPPTMSLSLEILIKYQTESQVYNNETVTMYIYFFHEEFTLKLWEKYIKSPRPRYDKIPSDYKNVFGDKVPKNYNRATDFINRKETQYAKNIIFEIMQVSLLSEYYSKTSNQDKHIKILKILIYTNYLLCWLYVLLISLPSLNVELLYKTLNSTWAMIVEPFSETHIK